MICTLFQVLAAPTRLDKRIGEAKIHEIQDRLLAKVVVDAENGRLGKIAMERAIQLLGGSEVAAERLFHNDTGIARAIGSGQSRGNHLEHARRNRQVMQRAPGGAQRRSQLGKSRGVSIVAVNVLQERGKLRECRRVERTVRRDALFGPRLELFQAPTRLGDPDHRHVEDARGGPSLAAPGRFLKCQIAARAKKNKRIGLIRAHDGLLAGSFLFLALYCMRSVWLVKPSMAPRYPFFVGLVDEKPQ